MVPSPLPLRLPPPLPLPLLHLLPRLPLFPLFPLPLIIFCVVLSQYLLFISCHSLFVLILSIHTFPRQP